MAARGVAKAVMKTTVDTIKVAAVLDPSGVVEALQIVAHLVRAVYTLLQDIVEQPAALDCFAKHVNMLAHILETLQQEAGRPPDLSKPIIDNMRPGSRPGPKYKPKVRVDVQA
jgi:hypothetical protein